MCSPLKMIIWANKIPYSSRYKVTNHMIGAGERSRCTYIFRGRCCAAKQFTMHPFLRWTISCFERHLARARTRSKPPPIKPPIEASIPHLKRAPCKEECTVFWTSIDGLAWEFLFLLDIHKSENHLRNMFLC